MAYREGNLDPRIPALAQLVATEPEVREELKTVRFQADGRVREVDDLEVELAKLERGGLFGLGKKKAAIAEAAEQLRIATLARDMSNAREQQLKELLADIAAARTELATLERAAQKNLRESDGPLGDELRALADALAATDRALASVEAAMTAADTALAAIHGVEAHVESIITYGNEPFATAIPHARSCLFGFAHAAGALVFVPPGTAEAIAAIGMLQHEPMPNFVRATITWSTRIERALSELLAEKTRLVAQRADHSEREAEITAAATR